MYCETITVEAVKPSVEVTDIKLLDNNGNEVSPIKCGGTPIFLRIYLKWIDCDRIHIVIKCGKEKGDENKWGEFYVSTPAKSGSGHIDVTDNNKLFDPAALIEPCCGSCDCSSFKLCVDAEPA